MNSGHIMLAEHIKKKQIAMDFLKLRRFLSGTINQKSLEQVIKTHKNCTIISSSRSWILMQKRCCITYLQESGIFEKIEGLKGDVDMVIVSYDEKTRNTGICNKPRFKPLEGKHPQYRVI